MYLVKFTLTGVYTLNWYDSLSEVKITCMVVKCYKKVLKKEQLGKTRRNRLRSETELARRVGKLTGKSTWWSRKRKVDEVDKEETSLDKNLNYADLTLQLKADKE